MLDRGTLIRPTPERHAGSSPASRSPSADCAATSTHYQCPDASRYGWLGGGSAAASRQLPCLRRRAMSHMTAMDVAVGHERQRRLRRACPDGDSSVAFKLVKPSATDCGHGKPSTGPCLTVVLQSKRRPDVNKLCPSWVWASACRLNMRHGIGLPWRSLTSSLDQMMSSARI